MGFFLSRYFLPIFAFMTQVQKKDLSLMVTSLPLMEKFYTIQGEGYWSGSPAYFIRLAGCDVGCVWCDVKESWQAEDHQLVEVESMMTEVVKCDSQMVVVTGGEPAMYDLTFLTHKLIDNGKRTHIETSGVYPLTGTWHWICFSPKKFKAPHPDIYNTADELKVVVYNASDLNWAEQHAKRVRKQCKLYLQPEWGKINKVLPLITAYVKDNPKWNISLQSHKYMGIP